MRTSIYDALDVNSSSSVDTIKAALRAVVRRFWAVPRDASADSEEAVRFAALGAAILVDETRRKDYDAALNPGVGAGPWRLPVGQRDSSIASESSTNSRVMADGTEPSQLSIEAKPPSALPGVDALAEPLPDGKAWNSPMIFAALAVAILLLCYAFAKPLWSSVPLTLVSALLAGAGAAAVLLALSLWVSRSVEPPAAAASLSRLAIIKWRREGSIFIGQPPPQHDTAWVFKLRLMELTRSAAGFITATNAWRRLIARLTDYALVALAVFAVIELLDRLIAGFDLWFALARSPLVLPIVVALVAMPYEAILTVALGTTPGKWLFSLTPVIGVTRPGDHSEPSDSTLMWRRAARAAWSGAMFGIWPVALLKLGNNMRLARERETDWEAAGDTVTMARPMAAPAVATGLVLLLAATLLIVSAWRRDAIMIWPHVAALSGSARTAIGDALPKPASAPAPAAESAAAPAPDAMPAPAAAAAPAVASVTPAAPPRQTVTPMAVNVPPPVAPAPVPAKPSAAEAEMSKQASAAAARRNRIDGYARQAEAAKRSGNYAGLQASCQRWTEEQPGSAEAWRCFGLAQHQNGAGREALPALRQALKLEPNDAQVEAAILRTLRP